MLQRVVEACPSHHVNNRYFRLARLLGATVDARAWSDAETVVGQLLPYIAEVRSGRAVRLLRGATGRMQAQPAPARLLDAGRHLERVLAATGYEDSRS